MSSLQHLPLILGMAGAFVVPAMWSFVLDRSTLMAMAPVTGLVFLASGLYLKYRARYSPREALWATLLAVLFFGSLLVASTSGLAWRAHRPDLQPLALGLAALMLVGGMATGVVAERRRLRIIDTATGLPGPLAPLVDLQRHRIRPLPSPPPPRTAVVAALTAVALQAPLLLQTGGWTANDVVWLAMPALAATVTMVLASGFGPALARALALLNVQQRLGRPLVTTRLEELQAMRRGFWLSRWLARATDSP